MTRAARAAGRWTIAMAAWAAIGTALTTATSAIAQDEQQANAGELIVIGEQHEKPSLFHIDPPTGEINLLARYEKDISNQAGLHQSTAESLFEETLTVQ